MRADFYANIKRVLWPDHSHVQRENIQHSTPHIHVTYQGKEAEVSLDGEYLKGRDNIPANRKAYLDAWMDIHRDELYANWDLLSAGEPYQKIEPLK